MCRDWGGVWMGVWEEGAACAGMFGGDLGQLLGWKVE